MANLWKSPASGKLLNGGQPWRRGDVVDLLLEFNNSPQRIDLIGGDLPPGLNFNGATRRIYGTILALPKDQDSYPVVFRAVSASDPTKTFDRSYKWIVDPRDEEQSWAMPAGLQDLGAVNRGSSVNIQLDIINPDMDNLTYKAMGVRTGIPGTHEGLPNGLAVEQAQPNIVRIIGSPTVTGNQPGAYYFKVYARDPDDVARNPHGEGAPRTSEKTYRITLNSEIVLDARLSDTVRWETPAGSLGSTYETYPSHFAVKAVPQYQVNGSNNLEVQIIRYTLTGRSNPLPDGLLLDPNTGLILGRCPYVVTNTSFEFKVEARVVFQNQITGEVRQSSVASERSFSVTIRSIFASDSVTTLQVNVPGDARRKIVRWIWGNTAELREPSAKAPHELTLLGRDNNFRPSDQLFGKKKEYNILVAAGLNYVQDGSFLDKLKDYHHPTTWRIGKLASSRARSPEGVHLYDVLYLTVIDPMSGAGGFDAGNKEVTLSRYQPGQKQTAIPVMNLSKEDSHYFPNSIRNMRLDMQSNRNRQDWAEQAQTAGTRGYGLVGREGLPLWMMSEQEAGKPATIPGYQTVIELAYVKAGSGPALVRALEQAGFNEDLQGTTISVDRYLLLSDGFTSTTFDFDPDTGALTTFDGPDNAENRTTQLTSFDKVLQSESKYYKFPPGDK